MPRKVEFAVQTPVRITSGEHKGKTGKVMTGRRLSGHRDRASGRIVDVGVPAYWLKLPRRKFHVWVAESRLVPVGGGR